MRCSTFLAITLAALVLTATAQAPSKEVEGEKWMKQLLQEIVRSQDSNHGNLSPSVESFFVGEQVSDQALPRVGSEELLNALEQDDDEESQYKKCCSRYVALYQSCEKNYRRLQKAIG